MGAMCLIFRFRRIKLQKEASGRHNAGDHRVSLLDQLTTGLRTMQWHGEHLKADTVI